MTGSAKVINASILQGAPIYQNANGNVALANEDFPAFAIATDGTPPGGIATYTTDGTVERSDWSPILGKKLLVPGIKYFLSGAGKISTSGQQQVGIAQSRTVLQVAILRPEEPVIQLFTTRGKPKGDLGKIGDIALDEVTLKFWIKSNYGWKNRGRLVEAEGDQVPMLVKGPYGWQPFAT